MKLGFYIVTVWLSALLAAPVAAQTASPSKSAPSAAATAPGSQEREGLVDINAASAEELDRLPGVGPVRAKAIISHRPYSGKDDLVQRKIIPQNVYDQIKDKIIARQGPRASSRSTGSASKSR
ncbi:MAG: helix-hairpin-helix domain-containing protein [Alphaproteobacteria bacterium]|nr:helix-hairpin-helix domain-containing protein [Alphaproteobacteria bacterium]MBV9202658.1 helix-hairpin-helix domain-containing protein [Alphaproteobacteria bacterium]MBV9376183.1 helix-hairpin-helix domain-containing protein [Alphaproteobacteria bacterium]MBV9814945.1 helix-hairpin-helix domain-containing protein [Alphaproteobacteria bacterium]